MLLVLESLYQLRNIQTQESIIKLRKFGNCEKSYSFITKLCIKKSQSIFWLTVFGLVRSFDEIIAHCDLLLICEINCSYVHTNIQSKMSVLLNKMSIVFFKLFFHRKMLNDLFDLLNLQSFFVQFTLACILNLSCHFLHSLLR